MKKLRVLALMHANLVPPDDVSGFDVTAVPWKMEFDVAETLRYMGHEVFQCGVEDDLGTIRKAIAEFKPHIVFNLLESFHGIGVFDSHVVGLLELLRVPYTGCNPRGLMLARDKSLSKTLMTGHRIPVPDYLVVRMGRKARRPKGKPPLPVFWFSPPRFASTCGRKSARSGPATAAGEIPGCFWPSQSWRSRARWPGGSLARASRPACAAGGFPTPGCW